MPSPRTDPAALIALPARYHRAFNDRDFEVWREVFAEDVELFVDGTEFRGVDAAVAYGVGSVAQFPNLHIGAERVIAVNGDTVVTEIDLVHADPAGGQSRRQGTVCEISRVRDGRIVSCRSYYMAEPADRADAVRVPDRWEATQVAEEQAALRRVATLVARGVSQEEMFAAVNEEIGWLVGADPTSLMRFEPDDTATLVAAWSARTPDLPIGSSRPLDDELRAIRETGRVLRWGPEELPLTGPFVEEARRLGIRSAVGVPIVVDGRVWGVAFASSTENRPLAEDAEARIAGFTELVATAIANAQSRADARRLSDEQAALRRVATLVARGSPPEEVFAAVAKEVGQLLQLADTRILRYDSDRAATVVAVWGENAATIPLGSELSLEGDSAGVFSAVTAPIRVEGRLWGAINAARLGPDPMPADTEARMGAFAELLATAISNVKARTELAASRARVVAAADDERRRVVRDLHDGAQQRLVHTVVTLKLADRALQGDGAGAPELVREALDHAQLATDELRELAHGILPTVLTAGGLAAAVEALASRTPVPVAFDVSADRLPAPVEATAYFVIAEALTNISKHARARSAAVSARVEGETLRISVRDDGVGGARPEGSGLLGLRDRLATLDGWIRVDSQAAGGTLVTAEIPLAGH